MKSKEELQKENARLFMELQEIEKRYKEAHHLIEQLDAAYEDSKGGIPVLRYNRLKEIIKMATSESMLKKIHRYAKEMSDMKSSSANMGKLLQRCREFAGHATSSKETLEIPPEIKQMTKQELIRNEEKMRMKLSGYPQKFMRIYSCLESLQRAYQESKGQNPITRYNELKEMIKNVTSDRYV